MLFMIIGAIAKKFVLTYIALSYFSFTRIVMFIEQARSFNY